MMRLALALIVAAAVTGGYLALSSTNKMESVSGASLATIEIADSPEERMQGLSGRKEIPDDYGMLFIFSTPGSYGFWMKDMETSIDIAWIGDEGEILGVERSVAPSTYPTSFYPPVPVRYVLETRAGLMEERGWATSTVLDLPLP